MMTDDDGVAQAPFITEGTVGASTAGRTKLHVQDLPVTPVSSRRMTADRR